MGLKEDFELAADAAKTLPDSISNEDKLKLYGLYKQATVGDVDTGRPGIFDQKGRAKWDVWNEQIGTSTEEAMTKYVQCGPHDKLVEELKSKYAS